MHTGMGNWPRKSKPSAGDGTPEAGPSTKLTTMPTSDDVDSGSDFALSKDAPLSGDEPNDVDDEEVPNGLSADGD
jgi:hypothetical protein